MLPSLIEAANITPIAALLFGCIFLITVQDIAVDGWCLTLLTEDCVGAAANCQVVGQGLGALSYNLYFSVMVPYFELPFETYLKSKFLKFLKNFGKTLSRTAWQTPSAAKINRVFK